MHTGRMFVVIMAFSIGMYLVGALAPLENALTDLRFRLLARPASGSLAIVEIDARSLQSIDVWPWPREHHADAVDRLVTNGAVDIAFDIDFSARSTAEGDRRFAEAIAAADGRVILPTFLQYATSRRIGTPVLENRPLPMFAEHARIGSVNVFPATDAFIRSFPVYSHTLDSEAPIRSLPAVLAGPSTPAFAAFAIDYAIDPETIPRLSFADLLSGSFDRNLIDGRRIIVGATAVELGDHFAVPVHRILDGPVIQALAYESLVQNRALLSTGPVATVAGSVLIGLLLAVRFRRWSWQRCALVLVASCLAIFAATLAVQKFWPVLVESAPWYLVLVIAFLWCVLREVEELATQLFRQRMALNYRRALMDRVVSDSFDGVVITDRDGAVEVFNAAAASILGIDEAEARTRRIDGLLPGLGPLAEAGDAAPEPQEIVFDRPDGEERILEVVMHRFIMAPGRSRRERRTADRPMSTYIFRDITERKEIDRMRQEAADQAIAANRAKTEFLANMSHELRTPLNAIIGFSELMHDQALGPIGTAQYADYARDIHSSGRHLLGLINDILDASLIESGRFELAEQAIDAGAVIRSCRAIADGWRDRESKEFDIAVEDGLPQLRADPRVFRQIVLNLLSNAMKFTRAGDRVTVSAGLDASGGLFLTVADTGIGMSPDVISRLTEPFEQLETSMQRRYGGSGLGLALVAAYVEMHQGRLEIDSHLDTGTAVTVRFPAARCVGDDDRPGSRTAT